jgi:transcriptional regulator with XRE-family HTH domain
VTAQLFGDSLRRERERRGLLLQDIAEQTKITRSLLGALEKGDCSRWPGGIYARAYVRAYAQALGLDAEELVADFCEIFPQFARPEPVEPPPGDEGTKGGSVGRSRFAQLRDILNRADSRLNLFPGVERSE